MDITVTGSYSELRRNSIGQPIFMSLSERMHRIPEM